MFKMIQRAGVALSRLVYDAEYSITRVHYDPDPTFLPPTRHKLIDAYTATDIIDMFRTVIKFDTKSRYNGFEVAIPIGASGPQQEAFSLGRIPVRSHDHFHAWANLYAKKAGKVERDVNLLFIDLTTGQEASVFFEGGIGDSGWGYGSKRKQMNLNEDASSLSLQAIYDKLVTSVVPSKTTVHQVGILRLESALPGVSNADLEVMFVGMPVEWVTLDDLSHGAAFVMSKNQTFKTHEVYYDIYRNAGCSMGIMLANEKVVTIVSKGTFLPTRDKLMFTNSEDDQTTATVQLFEDNDYYEELTLEGLTPSPKGQARIKVELVIDHDGEVLVTIQELGTNLKAHRRLGVMYYSDTLYYDSDDDDLQDSSIEQIEMTFGEDGVIGELPE